MFFSSLQVWFSCLSTSIDSLEFLKSNSSKEVPQTEQEIKARLWELHRYFANFHHLSTFSHLVHTFSVLPLDIIG